MINPKDLISGKVYFLLGFYHPKLSIPMIHTYIFIGKNVFRDREDTSKDEWIFQDPESYIEYGCFLDLSENQKKKIEPEIICFNEDTIQSIYDLNELISKLKELKVGKLDQLIVKAGQGGTKPEQGT